MTAVPEEELPLSLDPECFGVFQNGAMEGPQTVPGKPIPLSEGWEDDAYQLLLNAWRQRKTEINVLPLNIPWASINDFWDVGRKVLNDHPELFYADFYGTASGSGGLIARQTFKYRGFSDLDGAIRDFDAAVDEAMAQIQGVTDNVEKALLLHDWLVTRCAYNWEIAWNLGGGPEPSTAYVKAGLPYTAYGPLVGRDAVCQGYALAYKYLLNQVGIRSIYLSSSTMNHGWNGVMIGDQWYHVDVTWDDSTPNKEGHCGHVYFLLSDGTVSDASHRHNGWDKNLITCGDTSYESGWAFLGSFAPFYRRDGFYYYTRPVNDNGGSETGVNAVFRNTSLRTAGEDCLTAELGRGIWRGGAVWLDGRLYLAPYSFDSGGSRLILVYDLDTGLTAQAALFPFTASPSSSGQYDESNDRNLGLRYNAEAREIEAVSCTRREVVASFPARALSGGWAQAGAPEDGLALAPGLSKDGAAALLYAADAAAPEGASLWAAFYRGGKLADLRSVPVPERVENGVFNILPPLVLAYPDLSNLPEYDSVRLMLLTGDGLAPLCAAG